MTDENTAPRLSQEGDSQSGIVIVGIGASAGGLTALKQLLDNTPSSPGVAVVVVVHLSPEHESRLAEILQPHCSLPVQQVTETTQIERDHVYVIPPNANLNTIDTHLRLTELEERRRERAPIDHFFRTLAKTHDGRSIGVILTGTGSDGTLGLRRIKERGGLTIVQDPDEAEYDGMPRSAIASGMVDLILPVTQIPAEISRFASIEPQIPLATRDEEIQTDQTRILQKIFAQVRARTGHDFSQYKRSTILRRIQRRMQLHHLETLTSYLDLIRERRDEANELFNDLLITVTEFFRDGEVFRRLEKDIIPQLFEGKGPDDKVRVWSVGCSTGEEAYSLAMLLIEEASRRDVAPEVQIFASDLHERALVKAREGVYPEEIAGDVSPERLQRFFVREEGHYRVRREVRELVVFASHSLLRDPPFSHLGLIVCRNLLIYLQRDVQQDVMALFHYALEPHGMLMLGTSETVDRTDLFTCEDKNVCLFRRRNVPARESRLPVFPLSPVGLPAGPDHEDHRRSEEARPGYGVIHERIVERFAPPSVLVDQAHEVVHASVHAGRYLQVPGGEPTNNIFKLVREPLRMDLRAALHDAQETGGPIRSKPRELEMDGEQRRVALQVHPAADPDPAGFFLVIFDEFAAEQSNGDIAASAVPEMSATSRELEAELDINRQRLQAMIEEHESSREEMKASNEELQSANEELRSTLEELETSKEELQSMNEELTTFNQENRHRVEELRQLTADLANLMAATEIATLFLDRKLRIVRFTPQIGRLFNVRQVDRGRPLSDLTNHLGYKNLQHDAQAVLDQLTPIEREIEGEDERSYLTRILPYRGSDDRIEGVVITLIDITERKRAEESQRLLASIVESSYDAIVSKTLDGIILTWNSGAERLFGYSAAEAVGQSIMLIIPRELAEEEESILHHLRRNEPLPPFETVRVAKDGRMIDVSLTISPIRNGEGQIIGASKVARDISDRKRAEQALREARDELEHRVADRTSELQNQTTRLRTLTQQLTTSEHDERKRLAAHLHDGLQQLLVGASFHLRELQKRLSDDQLKSAFDDLDNILKQSLSTCRDLTRHLRPPVLYDGGLVAALRWLGSEMEKLQGLKVEYQAPDQEIPLSDELKAMLFEAVRELLFNVVKHSDSREAIVSVKQNDERLTVTVKDHGPGCDAAEMKKGTGGKGLGLFGIQERLEGLGGRMHIESSPQGGTCIRMIVPTSDLTSLETKAE